LTIAVTAADREASEEELIAIARAYHGCATPVCDDEYFATVNRWRRIASELAVREAPAVNAGKHGTSIPAWSHLYPYLPASWWA